MWREYALIFLIRVANSLLKLPAGQGLSCLTSGQITEVSGLGAVSPRPPSEPVEKESDPDLGAALPGNRFPFSAVKGGDQAAAGRSHEGL